jgi:hypothetical protein
LQKAEAIKNLFQRLKSLQLVRQKSGVTCIEIPSLPTADPKTCSSWLQMDIPDEVALHLSERNRRHFGQAAGSPFTKPPLSIQLGYDAQSVTAERLLHGEYVHEDNNPNIQLLLQYMNFTGDNKRLPMETTISGKEYTAANYGRCESQHLHRRQDCIWSIIKLLLLDSSTQIYLKMKMMITDKTEIR